MSRSWPRPTSTMPLPQVLVRNRPRRIIKCSSRPSADTREIRSVSAPSSAAPQRLTAELTVCHTQPSSAATSLSGRPRPAWRVAHRAARAVNSALAGAISAACSVALPASQPPRGQRQRRLCHTSRTGRPNAGRSTSATGRSPSDHNSPPHPPTRRSRHPPADTHPQRRTLLVVDAEHLDIAQSHQQLAHARRVALHRDPPWLGCFHSADSGGSLAFSRGPLRPPLRPHSRRAAIA